MSKKRRLTLLRRIHVSNIEIKQTNSKAVISLYIINTEKKRMKARYLNVEIQKRILILLNEFMRFLMKGIKIFNKKNTKMKNFLKKNDKKYKKFFHFTLFKLIFHLKKWSYISFISKFSHYKFIKFYFFELKNYYFKYLLYNLKHKFLISKSYQEIKLMNKIKKLKKNFKE
jgi:hypothetical protein